jgi:hypothetical protein
VPDPDPFLPSPPVHPDTPPAIRLFGPEAIAAHTVLLTPLVGSAMAALNHRRLGNRGAARRTALAFAAPSALLLVAQVAASGPASQGLLRLAGFAWTIAVARQLFLEHQVLFAKHAASGGQAARWYLVTLVVVGLVLVGLAAVFASELV